MTLLSFETRQTAPITHALVDGPVLVCAPPGVEPGDQLLGIRARRLMPTTPDELFAAWTSRAAWESWLRLRARSRATITANPGSSFRLELAEGPTIHVITGTVREVQPDEFLSLTWVHENTYDHGSVIDVSFTSHGEQTELELLHYGIASRREAAWLMRLWTAALSRFTSSAA
jgi:uncharacterized protein YndB with AHSA1/START domain